jgi:signal transduction histidine kinase
MAEKPPPSAPDSEAKARILVVDDQPDNLLSVEAVLEKLGEQVVTAQSGREALRCLLDSDFAVIVLDVMMPDMDGFETAALIRARERSKYTPIIFLTALGRSEAHVFRGYEAGAVDFLAKPYVPELLRAKVSVFVELHKQGRLLERRNAELEDALARQRAAEQDIQQLNRRLEQQLHEVEDVNSELETFSYSVSHDLRGPLARIVGFSRALLELHSGALDEEGKLYAARILSAAEKTTQLVDALLNLARLTRTELRREPVDLAEIARSIAGELEARDPSRRVEFRIAMEAKTAGDPTLLRAAMLNLLENAYKYTGRTEHALIEFGAGAMEDIPFFYVRDNGAGFESDHAQNLFQPFHRLHSTAEFEGSGIGLATVDRIIRRHGGRIWAEAKVGQGATFYFTLPARTSP